MSGRLVQVAKHKGSTDNITVVVVFLRDPLSIARRPLPAAPVTPPPSVQATPTMEERLKEFEELSAKWGYGSEAEHQHQHQHQHQQQQQQQQQQDESASSANAQENNELNPMATKYGWGESEGGAVFNELPWQDQQQQQQQQQMFDENNFMSNDNKESENYQWQTHDPSDFLNGTGETPESVNELI